MNDHNDAESRHPEVESLEKEQFPSPALENRVRSALRRQRLLNRDPQSAAGYWRVAAVAVASLLFFIAGVWFQQHRASAKSASVSMSEKTYVLFLIEDQNYRSARDEREEMERVNLYRNWAHRLRQKGVAVSGTKLQRDARLLETGGKTLEHNESEIAGYFLIDTRNFNEAIKIARSCPHLRFGGRIEVRRIQPV